MFGARVGLNSTAVTSCPASTIIAATSPVPAPSSKMRRGPAPQIRDNVRTLSASPSSYPVGPQYSPARV